VSRPCGAIFYFFFFRFHEVDRSAVYKRRRVSGFLTDTKWTDFVCERRVNNLVTRTSQREGSTTRFTHSSRSQRALSQRPIAVSLVESVHIHVYALAVIQSTRSRYSSLLDRHPVWIVDGTVSRRCPLCILCAYVWRSGDTHYRNRSASRPSVDHPHSVERSRNVMWLQ